MNMKAMNNNIKYLGQNNLKEMVGYTKDTSLKKKQTISFMYFLFN